MWSKIWFLEYYLLLNLSLFQFSHSVRSLLCDEWEKNNYVNKIKIPTIFEIKRDYYQPKMGFITSKIFDFRDYLHHINMQTHNSRKSVCAVPLNDNRLPTTTPHGALTPQPLCGGAFERSAASVEAYHRLSRLCTWADPLTPHHFPP